MAEPGQERTTPISRGADWGSVRAALAVLLLVAEATTACAAHQQKAASPTPPLPTPPPPQTMTDAKGLTEFSNKVQEYDRLHQRMVATLPKLPDRADPATVAAHQKTLAKAIRKSRPRPRPGHVFVPSIQPYFKRVLASELKGPGSTETREKVAEGNPEPAKGLPKDPDVKPKVVTLVPYADYPLDAPVSTVPPPVLLRMPQLPKELEYRFVGKDLVLRDSVANIIVDFIPNAVP